MSKYLHLDRNHKYYGGCNLILNNNEKIYMESLDIYGSDNSTDSCASPQKPSSLSKKAHKGPHPWENYSISSCKIPPEDYLTISVKKEQNNRKHPNTPPLPVYDPKQIQTYKTCKNISNKTRDFCVDITESETNIISHIFCGGCYRIFNKPQALDSHTTIFNTFQVSQINT